MDFRIDPETFSLNYQSYDLFMHMLNKKEHASADYAYEELVEQPLTSYVEEPFFHFERQSIQAYGYFVDVFAPEIYNWYQETTSLNARQEQELKHFKNQIPSFPKWSDFVKTTQKQKNYSDDGEPVVDATSRGQLTDVNWEDLQTLDYQELTSINALVTSLAFYPVLCIAFFVTAPVQLIIATVQWISCGFSCRPDMLDKFVDTASSFARDSWAVPYGWIFQFYALGWNTLYWLYLVYLFSAKWIWSFLEVYAVWFTDLIGVSLDFAWYATEWLFGVTYWSLFYILKNLFIFLQWIVEFSWDSIEWLWNYFKETFVWIYDTTIWLYYWSIDAAKWMWEKFKDLMVWFYETFEGLVTISIIIPTWFTAKFIKFFEWAVYFVYRYDDFIGSAYFLDIAFLDYLWYYSMFGLFSLYFMLWPITLPISSFWLLWLVTIAWWW